MSGLRFESMADMPPRMRELYARQQIDLSGAAAPAPLAKGSQGKPKYGSQKAERGTIRFDSQKEARRYDEQPQFTLQESYLTEGGERIRAIRYTADFLTASAGSWWWRMSKAGRRGRRSICATGR